MAVGCLTETPEGVILNVKAQPRSSKAGIDGLLGDAVKVRIGCAPVDGKAVTPEMLGRMLNRERFTVAVWRSVAAALDKMEQKKGVDAG